MRKSIDDRVPTSGLQRVMGKNKAKAKKFAEVKRILNPKEARVCVPARRLTFPRARSVVHADTENPTSKRTEPDRMLTADALLAGIRRMGRRKRND